MIDAPRLPRVALAVFVASLLTACVGTGKRASAHRGAGSLANASPEGSAASIAGVVQDRQGRPLPAVWIEVEGHPNPFSSPPAWRTDVHGRFRIPGLPPGPKTLLVTSGAWSRDENSQAVETRTGMRDLVIVLDPGPQLFLRIADYVPGEQTRWARLTWEDPDGTRHLRHAPIHDDGRVRFVDLPPDRALEVWATAETQRRHVRAGGLRPRETEQRIEQRELKTIAGRVQASEARMARRIAEDPGTLFERITVDVYAHAWRSDVRGIRVTRARLAGDGTFRVRGLPPGTYWLDVGTRGGEIINIYRSVEAGTTDAVFEFK